MLKQLEALLEGEDYLISKMANMSAFLNENMKEINWVGFYIAKGDILKLGPFQGKVACSNIPIGVGVCGTCYMKKESIIVPNVHEFATHIACDVNSKSEIVIPIIRNGEMIALLDIDSPIYDRFTKEDEKFLKECVSLL